MGMVVNEINVILFSGFVFGVDTSVGVHCGFIRSVLINTVLLVTMVFLMGLCIICLSCKN